MADSSVRTRRLEPGLRTASRRVAANQSSSGHVYASRTAVPVTPVPPIRPGGAGESADLLRRLATAGALAAAAEGPDRAELTSAAYDLVWPIVFSRLTRRLEQQRGHFACAAGVDGLADDCLDRFHDDVESVVDDLLTHARRPIDRLEAWIAARLGAATVNGHRRRRGSRGALQRPRLPGWLALALGEDRWLTALAVDILVWVGVRGTAGTGTWPLESWAQQRAEYTGDWAGSNPATVEREVELTLDAMRTRPGWYESFVERPLGAKQAPVAAAAVDPYGEPVTPLALGEPDQQVESEMHRLAGDAVAALRQRLARGEQAERAVVEVIRSVFGGGLTSTLDRAPHSGADPVGGVTAALSEQDRLRRIVSEVLSIVGDEKS
ncbi:hypothetical protein [Actinoplanes sp. NPDC051851]|uniref:hypothetical protein n=1 Tax=Actinoplanes sp. NPDC051851 TaxID=3154753 RepID=UPI0034137F72